MTYNGKPLEKGAISFVPEDPKGVGRKAGDIENGSYTLSTGGNRDGARPGKYKVTVTAREDVTAKAKADFAKDRKRGAGPKTGYIPKEFVSKAEAHAKSLIPPDTVTSERRPSPPRSKNNPTPSISSSPTPRRRRSQRRRPKTKRGAAGDGSLD